MKDSYKSLKKISKELNLDFETQDWGIINSSPERLIEFIDYFKENVLFDNQTKYEIFDLIIASFNDGLVENKFKISTIKLFVDFIYEYSPNETFKPILDYWKSIKNEEYPVSYFFGK